MSSPASVPVTAIGGYLGAGKTTLINRLLADDAAVDTAVLVNDYGAVNIDAELIASRSPDGRVVGLANGCVCCSIQDDLAGAMERLAGYPLRHVLLEASGVALPLRLADVGETFPGYEHRGVAVVVNADDYAKRRQDRFVGRLVQQQVRQADVLVVRGCAGLEFDEFESNPVQSFAADSPGLVSLLLNPSEALQPWARGSSSHSVSDGHLRFEQSTWSTRLALPRHQAAAWLRQQATHLHRAKGRLFDAQGGYELQLAGGEVTVAPGTAVGIGTLVMISPQALPTPPPELGLSCLA